MAARRRRGLLRFVVHCSGVGLRSAQAWEAVVRSIAAHRASHAVNVASAQISRSAAACRLARPERPGTVVTRSRPPDSGGSLDDHSERAIHRRNVDEAIAFYRDELGFAIDMHPAPPFAMLSRGDLRLLLSAPSGQGGGGQILPDGRRPEPGGWNRIQLDVPDLPAEVERLRAAGVRFRSDIIHGIGGDQVLIKDPSGNPVELFAA